MSASLTRRTVLGFAAALAAPSLVASFASPLAAQEAGFTAAAETLAPLHGLIVRRAGETVFERSFGGRGLDSVANVKSVSKTLLALLTGIAVDRGLLCVDDPVLPLLGRLPTGDARDRLSVGHLLSMQTGLQSVSGPRYGAWVSSRDWVEAALAADPVDVPGGRFIYSTGGWHVLGAVLSRVTDRSLLALARDWLGTPLGVDFAPWVRDPQGRYLGGNDMGLTPRGLARVGEMVVAGGAWNGVQVVPRDWLARSWEPRGRSPFSGDLYGYGWFLTRLDGAEAAYGRGYGGQVLLVAPDRGLTVAITSDPTQPARSQGYFGDLRDLAGRIVAELS